MKRKLVLLAAAAICSAGIAHAFDRPFDLSSRTKEVCAEAVAHPTWRGSTEMCEILKRDAKAIAEGRVLIGIWDSEVLQAWHEPERIESAVTASSKNERWFYPGGRYLDLEDGVLVAIHTTR